MTPNEEALKLAEILGDIWIGRSTQWKRDAAYHIRRLVAANEHYKAYQKFDCGLAAEKYLMSMHDLAQANARLRQENKRLKTPLTDEQIRQIVNETVEGVTVAESVMFRAVARAVEAAHGIGEQT